MTKKDLFIFDLDGTLIESIEDIASAVNFTRRTFKMEALPTQEVARAIGDGVQSLISKILGPENLALKDKALEIFRNYYNDHLLDRTRLRAGAWEILEHFKNKPKAILTNKPKKFTVDILEGLGVRGAFCAVECGDNPAEKKPDPAGARRILEETHIKADRALLVGDSPVDIQTARAAGMDVCIVLNGYATEEMVKEAKPDFLIRSLTELKECFV